MNHLYYNVLNLLSEWVDVNITNFQISCYFPGVFRGIGFNILVCLSVVCNPHTFYLKFHTVGLYVVFWSVRVFFFWNTEVMEMTNIYGKSIITVVKWFPR